MKMYVVSFKSNNPNWNRAIDGVWSIYTSKNKAIAGINQYMLTYEETYFDDVILENGLHIFVTNKGQYTIEEMEVDSTF